RHVRPVEPLAVEKGLDVIDDRPDGEAAVPRPGGVGAEAGKVDGDHLPLSAQTIHDRQPALPAVGEAVEQDENRTRSSPFVYEFLRGHGPTLATGPGTRQG